jgi:hypothetical protein
MKVAIIMTGHLRNQFIYNFNSFKLFLLNKIPNYTFFIHTWDVHSLENQKSVNIKELEDLYNTKNIIIEKQSNDMLNNISHKSISFQMYSLYKIYSQFYNELEKYDYIIKLRPDIRFRRDIPLSFDNIIRFFQTNLGGGLDVFYYGNKKNMLETLQIYRNEYIQKINLKTLKKPEMIFLKFWESENILYEKNKLKFLKVITITH